jgi:hypothetical protein
MKYATVEDIVASLPHTILPIVQGEPDCQTIHVIRKLLHTNARTSVTHLGGGALGHLGLIISEAAYAIVAPTVENGPILWINPTSPGRAPAVIDQDTVAQLIAARHSWEEAVLTFRMFNTVQQALTKQIIIVFEPMYLGFAKIKAREMIEHLFFTYGSITAIDLEHNFEQMRKA